MYTWTEELRLVLHRRKISQRTLASMLDITEKSLGVALTRGDMKVSMFVKICAILEIDPNTLLRHEICNSKNINNQLNDEKVTTISSAPMLASVGV